MLKSDYELKIQKQHLHLTLMRIILIYMESAYMEYTQQSHKFNISHSYSLLTHLWRCMEN